MATRNLCPRAHSEGSLGKPGRSWADARLLALNGLAVNSGGKGTSAGYGLLKAADAAAVAAGAQDDAAVTPASLLGGYHPLRLGLGHELYGGFKAVAFMVRIANNGGTLQHYFRNQLGGTGISYVNPVAAPATSYVNTPTVGAGVDFVGGLGLHDAQTLIFDVGDTGYSLAGYSLLAVSPGRVAGCTTPGCYELGYVSSDVNGVTRPRLIVKLYTDAGGSYGVLSSIPVGGFISLNFTGYLPKQS